MNKEEIKKYYEFLLAEGYTSQQAEDEIEKYLKFHEFQEITLWS